MQIKHYHTLLRKPVFTLIPMWLACNSINRLIDLFWLPLARQLHPHEHPQVGETSN